MAISLPQNFTRQQSEAANKSLERIAGTTDLQVLSDDELFDVFEKVEQAGGLDIGGGSKIGLSRGPQSTGGPQRLRERFELQQKSLDESLSEGFAGIKSFQRPLFRTGFGTSPFEDELNRRFQNIVGERTESFGTIDFSGKPFVFDPTTETGKRESERLISRGGKVVQEFTPRFASPALAPEGSPQAGQAQASPTQGSIDPQGNLVLSSGQRISPKDPSFGQFAEQEGVKVATLSSPQDESKTIVQVGSEEARKLLDSGWKLGDSGAQFLELDKALDTPINEVSKDVVTGDSLRPVTDVTGAAKIDDLPATTAAATAAEAEATLSNLKDRITELSPPDTQASIESEALTNKMSELLGQLSGEAAALTTKEEELGVNQKLQDLKNVQNQLSIKSAAFNKLQADIASKPITMESIIGQQAQARAVAQADLGFLQAQASALQGDVIFAQEQARKSVDDKYAPIREEIRIKESQLSLLQPLLEKEEKTYATALDQVYKERRLALEAKQETESRINEIAIQAIANGADSALVNDIKNSTDEISATQVAGKFIGEEDLLSVSEAKSLGLPFGTTREEASQKRIVPVSKKTGTGVAIPSEIRFSQEEKKDIQAFKLENASESQQNIFVNALTSSEQREFERDRRQFESERNMSIPPETFLDEWLDKKLVEEKEEKPLGIELVGLEQAKAILNEKD